MAPQQSLQTLLRRRFPANHTDALVRHFQAMMAKYQESSWEQAILKGGKFVEATLKAIWVSSGKPLPPSRKFKVGTIITGLANAPSGTLDDSLRITIPRACEFVYDIASNRGARHDPAEVDPNEIDAAVVVATCSWIIAETIRYSQGGAQDPASVATVLSGLSQRRYPQVEEVDGRVYFHLKKISARKVALLSLWHRHPRRIPKADLIAAIERHHFSADNARLAVKRLAKVVDEDHTGAFRLLQPGLAEAESLIGTDLKISRKGR